LKEIIKKRQIKINNLTESNKSILITKLINLEGVKAVNIIKAYVLYVEYNLLKVNFETLEKKISEYNFQIKQSNFEKIKSNLIYFTEANEYDILSESSDTCDTCSSCSCCDSSRENKLK
jgi:hypothetical protein